MLIGRSHIEVMILGKSVQFVEEILAHKWVTSNSNHVEIPKRKEAASQLSPFRTTLAATSQLKWKLHLHPSYSCRKFILLSRGASFRKLQIFLVLRCWDPWEPSWSPDQPGNPWQILLPSPNNRNP